MIAARPRAWMLLVALAALALVVAATLALGARKGERADKPPLYLLTSLPIVFGEEFSLEGGGSPALTALEQRYRVVPISTGAARELGSAHLLLLAHPPPQTPENLVAIDRWVRGGGRLVLLADPLLEWPSARPLGDPLRPPPTFNDTGLLGHWGLRLDSPEAAGERKARIAGRSVISVSPGTLHGARCAIAQDRLVADCRIGRGRAIVVADADWIGAPAGAAQDSNLDALVALLDRLESGESASSR